MFGYDHNPWAECSYCGGHMGKHGCYNNCGGSSALTEAERDEIDVARKRQQEQDLAEWRKKHNK